MQQDAILAWNLTLGGAEVQAQAAVLNLFDRDPSAARLEYGYDPFVGNPLGRIWRLGLRFQL